jgi:hypothetical protein
MPRPRRARIIIAPYRRGELQDERDVAGCDVARELLDEAALDNVGAEIRVDDAPQRRVDRRLRLRRAGQRGRCGGEGGEGGGTRRRP